MESQFSELSYLLAFSGHDGASRREVPQKNLSLVIVLYFATTMWGLNWR